MSYDLNVMTVSTPKELDYLQKTYCKETNYMTLDDLKVRHKEYIYAVITLLRRFLQTQMLNLNNPGIRVYNECLQELQHALQYYRSLNDIKSVDTLRESCNLFKNTYTSFVSNILQIQGELPYSAMRSDVCPNDLSASMWEGFGRMMRSHLQVKGHHVNIYIPYPHSDLNYTKRYGNFLGTVLSENVRHFYSYFATNMPASLFLNGKYLQTTKDRINTKPHVFDAIIATRDSLFEDIRPRITSAVNLIIGLTTDFTRLDLKRIAATLDDIHVYFHTGLPAITPKDNELCMVVGTVKEPGQNLVKYRELLDIFANHTEDTTVYELLGSDENTIVPFSSYDITEETYQELLPTIYSSTQKILDTLIPKVRQDTRQPLLPFSSGQLGLILISGEINGSIREAESGCCHVVKGSSKQRVDRNTENTLDENGRIIHVKKTSNTYASTNVNVVLPSGSIRTLH